MISFDTGMGAHPAAGAHYRPRRVSVPEALAAAGAQAGDLRLAAKSHLHVGHCDGNPLLTQIPVLVQEATLDRRPPAPRPPAGLLRPRPLGLDPP